jgi:hypothetical protein
MFDIPSIFDNNLLGAQALGAYIGGVFGDPDQDTRELMNAMSIGAMTAGWFRMPATIGTNILSQKQKQWLNQKTMGIVGNPNANSFRNLLSQLKDDKILGRMIAEGVNNAQDDQHVGIFFDALRRGRTHQ